MPTINITMRLDEELVRRIDAVAERLGENRTYVVEKAIKRGLPETERVLNALERPMVGMALELLTRPSVFEAISRLAGEEMTEAEKAESVAAHERIRAARQRATQKSGKAKGKKNA